MLEKKQFPPKINEMLGHLKEIDILYKVTHIVV